ncbi:MAG: hypothetical protein HN566_03225 [Polaribacter sp.]|jgi:hypothetical protein|nr:hypothetical protein [Polaribacter sp.]
MKKDIIIPEISGVEMAIVFEYNGIYNTNDWNVYLINNNDTHLEMVVIVSKGFGNKKISSVMRKKIDVLDAHSFAKVEWIQPDLFKLTNQFQVTFFVKDRLYDKTFTFKENTVKEGRLRIIPELKKRGIIAKQE